MTDEMAMQILTVIGLEKHLSVNPDTQQDEEAFGIAIKAIKDRAKLKEAIQKIKDEIAKNGNSDINTQTVLFVIDKHTEGLI